MRTKLIPIITFALTFILVLTSCQGNQQSTESAQTEALPGETKTDSKVEPAEDKDSPKEETEEKSPILVERIEVTIPSASARNLAGVLYPANTPNAPLVILMHWAPGDQTNWVEVAHWLQNSGFGGKSNSSADTPWLDMYWFPKLPEDATFNVLTFTFSGCDGGCKSFDSMNWLEDAQAAVEFGFNLPNVDGSRTVIFGTSIGADGAADGCLHLNSVQPGSCQTAFSLSPGGYLTLPYEEAVSGLNSLADPVPAICFYAENDVESAAVCEGFEAENYTVYKFSADEVTGNGHGMLLIDPNISPNPLELLKRFLVEKF